MRHPNKSNDNPTNIIKFLSKTHWIFSKGTDVTMPYLIKDNFKLFFSEYDINNFYIPIGNSPNIHLYWTNSIDEIMSHYEKFVTIESNLNQT